MENQKITVKLRFNTECKDNRLYWRVLIGGIEKLAENVVINVKTRTSEDSLLGGIKKWHITCEANNLSWEGDI